MRWGSLVDGDDRRVEPRQPIERVRPPVQIQRTRPEPVSQLAPEVRELGRPRPGDPLVAEAAGRLAERVDQERLADAARAVPFAGMLIPVMRTKLPRLLPFFRSEAQLRILGLVLLNGNRAWSVDQVVEAVDEPTTTVHRELRRALDAGLVVRDESVRPHAYRAATASPAYEPLKSLLASTVGLESELSELLDETPGVRAAVIHGSWVDGRARPDSDVDVLVVGDVDLAELRRRARPIGRRTGRRIDLTAFRPDEFRHELAAGNGFLRKIVDSPVKPLVGDLEAQR